MNIAEHTKHSRQITRMQKYKSCRPIVFISPELMCLPAGSVSYSVLQGISAQVENINPE